MSTQWLRFRHQGTPGFGVLTPQGVQPYEGELFGSKRPLGAVLPLAGIEWEPPCLPSKMFALWNNFRAAAQKNGWAEPSEPLYFLKAANSFSAQGRAVPWPRSFEGRVLYEGELGVVIGKAGKNIALHEATDHIFGVTCVNDVTALDLLRADASFEQWVRAKSFDGFTPFGPVIATGLALDALQVRTLVNGRERQNYAVSDMFFSPAALVSRLSRDVTLLPGDVISCGTSLGAGPWSPGATVEVIIDGVGSLANRLEKSA